MKIEKIDNNTRQYKIQFATKINVLKNTENIMKAISTMPSFNQYEIIITDNEIKLEIIAFDFEITIIKKALIDSIEYK